MVPNQACEYTRNRHMYNSGSNTLIVVYSAATDSCMLACKKVFLGRKKCQSKKKLLRMENVSEEEGVKFSPYLYVSGRKRTDRGLGLNTVSTVHELTNSDQKQQSFCYQNVKGVWFRTLSNQKVIANNWNFSLQAKHLHITDLPNLTRIKVQIVYYRCWFSLSSCLCSWARLNRLFVSAASRSSISWWRSSRIAERMSRRSVISTVPSSWKTCSTQLKGSFNYLKKSSGIVLLLVSINSKVELNNLIPYYTLTGDLLIHVTLQSIMYIKIMYIHKSFS